VKRERGVNKKKLKYFKRKERKVLLSKYKEKRNKGRK
jgi:hypothetical protein